MAKPGKSLVVVYYPKGLYGLLAGYHIRVSGNPQSPSIGRGEFATFDVAPGFVSVSSEPDALVKGGMAVAGTMLSSIAGPGAGLVTTGSTTESERLLFQTQTDETHYLKIGVGAFRESIKEVPESVASKHLRDCHWLDTAE